MSNRERYTPTEFVGINEIESVILNEYKWIFKRQPNPDVGIDVQIEIVDDGYPTAKFIALQVKKGTSNFYLNAMRTKVSYYASFEHYEYWTDSSIPVFIMGLLDDGELYWQYASDKGMYEKLTESYRLDFPLNNKLNIENKEEIESIALSHLIQLDINGQPKKTLNSIMEYNSEINYVLRDFNETILNLSNYIEHYTNRTNEIGEQGKKAFELPNQEQFKTREKLIEKYRVQINALSNRFKPEINMSHEYFGEMKDLMLNKREIVKKKIEDKILESFLTIPQYHEFYKKLEYAIFSMNTMNTSIQEHPSYNSNFRKAKQNSKSNFNKLVKLLSDIKEFIKQEITTYNKK